jgi:microcystin-dependent protein
MTSAIDPTKPGEGSAQTADVRANFQAAKNEIEALQQIPGGDISAAWPVGSIHLRADLINPVVALGFGTWVAICKGRAIFGLDDTNANFETLLMTGGAETHTLTADEMPAHTHTQDSHNHTQDAHGHTQNSHNHTQDAHGHTQDQHTHSMGPHSHGQNDSVGGTVKPMHPASGTDSTKAYHLSSAALPTSTRIVTDSTALTPAYTAATNQSTTATNQATTATNQSATATNQATTATNQNTGGGQSHSILPPYLVLIIWQRTA